MTKSCPIMSFRDEHYEEIFCGEKECAFWDEKREQCCIKTMALATAADPLDKIREQAAYIPVRPTTGQKPQEYGYNNKTGDPNLVDQYICNGGL